MILLNLEEILKEIKQLEISKDEFYVEGNAALVIRGIIHDTDDIKRCNKNFRKYT